jgi:hypothetical protein
MSTRVTRHIEMDQNLAHGCMMAWKMTLALGLSSKIPLASLQPSGSLVKVDAIRFR